MCNMGTKHAQMPLLDESVFSRYNPTFAGGFVPPFLAF